MAQFKKRLRKELPKDPVFRAGYDQGYLDVANAVLTFFEQRFIYDEDRPQRRDSDETKFFLDSVREVSRFLKAERDKASERVKSAN